MKLNIFFLKLSFLIFIVESCLLSNRTVAQTVVVNDDARIDSIFKEFEIPILTQVDDSIWDANILTSLHIAVYCQIDTLGLVSKLILNPLYGIGNDIPCESYLWQEVQSSIIEASKKWLFKPSYYKLPSLEGSSSEVANSSALHRPYFGRQGHMIILSFYPSNGPMYTSLYGVNIYGFSGIFQKKE